MTSKAGTTSCGSNADDDKVGVRSHFITDQGIENFHGRQMPIALVSVAPINTTDLFEADRGGDHRPGR